MTSAEQLRAAACYYAWAVGEGSTLTPIVSTLNAAIRAGLIALAEREEAL